MKFELYVENMLLNNFHLIHKSDYHMIKVAKLCSEVTDRMQKF